MFIKVKLPWDVTIPAEDMDKNENGLMLQRAILIRLFDEFVTEKATKNFGYFVTIKNMEKIGEGKVDEDTGGILFPVVFSGINFKMFKGEILYGVVRMVLKFGVFLRSGLCENIYISHLRMPGYKFIEGENPIFVDQNMSQIQIDSTLRFIVTNTKWIKEEKEFRVLASIEGDNLGPV